MGLSVCRQSQYLACLKEYIETYSSTTVWSGFEQYLNVTNSNSYEKDFCIYRVL